MRITSKVFVIILLFVIINILLYIFLISNKKEIFYNVSDKIAISLRSNDILVSHSIKNWFNFIKTI